MKKHIFIGAGFLVVFVVAALIRVNKPDGTEKESGSGCVSCQRCSSEQRTSVASMGEVEMELDPPIVESSTAVQSADLEEIDISAPVKALLGQDGKKHNYPSLLAEINKLDYALSASDVAALMDMLAWSNERFPEKMRPIEINAVKNDVLDKLLRQETLPEGIGLHMATMAGDVNQDMVWRDYCVQFMDPFYERMSKETAFTPEVTELHGEMASKNSKDSSETGSEKSELEVVKQAMFGALDERGSTIAGTALIGLENLSRTHEEFDQEHIAGKAVEMASDETASAACRMTALRLSAQISNKEQGMHNVEVADAARSVAQTGETVLLRSAAIVTLGEVGGADDRELLESYLSDADRQIVAAAQMALKKMDTRL